jgi:hypothetical protein
MNQYKKVMRNVRVFQVLFLVGIVAGIATAASGAPGVGLTLIGLGLVGFFVLVAVVGWVKADR